MATLILLLPLSELPACSTAIIIPAVSIYLVDVSTGLYQFLMLVPHCLVLIPASNKLESVSTGMNNNETWVGYVHSKYYAKYPSVLTQT